MIKSNLIFGLAAILCLSIYARPINSTDDSSVHGTDEDETVINNVPQQLPISKVSTKWLKGDQPRLLSAMASSPTMHETLNGSKMNVKAIVGGWHAQAVGQYKNYIYVAFSDGKLASDKVPASQKNPKDKFGKLWVYNTKTNNGKMVDLEKGYPHPCSIQVTGKYLTIAIEAEYGISQAALGDARHENSMVLIFDLEKDPNCGVEAGRLVQDGMNCGGAGLTYSPKKKCWYMLVDQDTKKGRVAVYKSKNKNLNSWIKTPIAYYPRFGSGAGLNLITASDNSIWGLWYDSTHDKLPSYSKIQMAGDQVKLFKILSPAGKPVDQRKIFTHVVNLESPKVEQLGELLADRPGMRFGASLSIENGKIEVLTCQRNMAKEFNINRTRVVDKKMTEVMYVNFSKASGEIICSSVTNPSQTYKEKKMQSQSWNKTLVSPIKADLNYMSIKSVTSGFGSLSSGLSNLNKWSDAFEGQSNAPLVLFYLEGTEDIKGKMIEFRAETKFDKRKVIK